ncbi:ATP-dependent zinc metalloprotease FtsH, partial [Devosia sp.]|uniref:ATP-dependent zinc metalloprotease FtsH n=1 Tax=Devosia sp. TaxID=1871048 RepID=UPI001AC8C692
MDKRRTYNLWYFVVAMLLFGAFQLWLSYRSIETITYSQLLDRLKAGTIAEVTITESMIEGRYKTTQNGYDYFVSRRVDPQLVQIFTDAGVDISGGSDQNWLSTIISWVAPALILVGLWYFVFRGLADRGSLGGLTAIGKSKAKVYVETDTGVTFADVAGVDEAKAELQEIVAFLKDKQTYGRLGARIPKGVLLVGPPGTGKTLLARAVAGEAGVPFFSISGSEFVELFVGVGAARVRDLFEQARKAAPCIIFIDELDALGRARTPMGSMGGADEKEQTLNQLLAELDGFDPRVGIVLLAATNRPEILDPALLRSGRFDRQVTVDRPDRKGRAAILAVHLKKIRLAAGVDVDQIAAITPGFTGADLANLCNEAAITATRRGGTDVAMQDFTAAVERIVAGSERRSRLLQPHERRRVACHELGHALVASAIPGADPVHKVSIIPRSIGALGYTMQRPTEDRYVITAGELKDRMAVLMGGRAAEHLTFGDYSTGASDDLAKATDIARQFAARFGMSETIGHSVLEQVAQPYLESPFAKASRDYSEATARELDVAVRDLIAEAFDRARRILEGRMDALRNGTDLLLEKEVITPDDFPALRRAEAAPD